MEHCETGTPCFMRSMDTLQTGCRCLPKESLPSHNNSLVTEL